MTEPAELEQASMVKKTFDWKASLGLPCITVLSLGGGMALAVACGSGGGAAVADGDASTPSPDATTSPGSDSGQVSSSGGSGNSGVPVNDAGSCDPSLACGEGKCASLSSACENVSFACGGAKLCDEAFFGYSDGSSSGGGGRTFSQNGPDTEKNARCVLAALRDGTPGRVSWGYSGGVTTYGETIDILPGRKVFGTWSLSVDSPSDRGAYQSLPLDSAQTFATCLEQGTFDAWGKCLDAIAKKRCP